MKLLIVLGLIPLISAQQMGYFDFPQGRANTYGSRGYGNAGKMWGLNNNNNNMWGLSAGQYQNPDYNNMWGMSAGQYQNQDFNNNNMWGLPTGIGGQPSYSNNQYQNNENLPGLDGVNAALIGQLRFMTDALESTLQKAAQDPNNAQAIDGVFEVMNNICVGSIDETIQLLNVAGDAAEMALVDSTNLLDDAVQGKVKLNKEGLEAAKVAAEEAFNKLPSSRKYQKKMKY